MQQEQTQPGKNDTVTPQRPSSVVLESILEPSQSVNDFFATVWQKTCAVYRNDNGRLKRDTNSAESTWSRPLPPWQEGSSTRNPWQTLVQHGPAILLELLDAASPPPLPRGVDRAPLQTNDDFNAGTTTAATTPLLFCNQTILTANERALYDDNLYAAFLDGMSVVLNHAELCSPWLAAICDDLQQHSLFPHAYANAYLTPAGQQTAPPHADDRDVLVLQVVGAKEWVVYEQVPIPYPYPAEQVGKDGLAVPDAVLQGPKLVQTVLHPGDVLYMPRGFVHQAKAAVATTTCNDKDDNSSQPSFHVTIALATHDWTLAGVLAHDLIPAVLMQQVQHRTSLLPWRHDSPSLVLPSLQQSLNAVFAQLQRDITAETVYATLQDRLALHNTRAATSRKALYDKYSDTAAQRTTATTDAVVGYQAARTITWTTIVRAATMAEREQCQRQRSGGKHHHHHNNNKAGLHVREAVADVITQILQHIKKHTNTVVRVKDLTTQCLPADSALPPTLCPLTLLAFCKVCVQLGALAVVVDVDRNESQHTDHDDMKE